MRLAVRGFGRVGAVRHGRCRSRHHWAIVRWDDRPERPDDPISPLIGWVEIAEFGQFKTKREAEQALAEKESNTQ